MILAEREEEDVIEGRPNTVWKSAVGSDERALNIPSASQTVVNVYLVHGYCVDNQRVDYGRIAVKRSDCPSTGDQLVDKYDDSHYQQQMNEVANGSRDKA